MDGDCAPPEEVRALSHAKLLRHLATFTLFVALVRVASPAWAWGDLGHRVICQIAFQELNDKARSEVIRLIALGGTFDSFPDACTWPDHPRKRAEEQFINVGRSVHAITVAQSAAHLLATPIGVFGAVKSLVEFEPTTFGA